MIKVTIDKDEKLEPCPCCEARADMVTLHYNERMDKFKAEGLHFRVSCSKCGMQTTRLSSKVQARKTWNRRPQVDL